MAADNSLDKLDFPYYQLSRFALGLAFFVGYINIFLIICIPISIILTILFKFISDFMASPTFTNNVGQVVGVNDVINLGIVGHPSKWYEAFEHMKNYVITKHLFIIPITVLILCIVFYGITVMLRHHSGERRPVLDDFKARSLKKELLSQLSIPKFSLGVSEDEKRKSELDKEAERSIRGTKIVIHTITDGKYELGRMRQYIRVMVPIPNKQSEKAAVWNRVMRLNEVMNDLLKGDMSFDEMTQLVDRTYFNTAGSRTIEVKIREKKPSVNTSNSKKESNVEGYQYAYDLGDFVDRTADINAKTEAATEHSKAESESVSTFLRSIGLESELVAINVGNTTIEYIYKMPYNTKSAAALNDLDVKMENNLYLKNGVQTGVSAGNLSIQIGLSPEMSVPIDVRSMVETVYGKVN